MSYELIALDVIIVLMVVGWLFDHLGMNKSVELERLKRKIMKKQLDNILSKPCGVCGDDQSAVLELSRMASYNLAYWSKENPKFELVISRGNGCFDVGSGKANTIGEAFRVASNAADNNKLAGRIIKA